MSMKNAKNKDFINLFHMNNDFQDRKSLILMRKLSENLKAENWKSFYFLSWFSSKFQILFISVNCILDCNIKLNDINLHF